MSVVPAISGAVAAAAAAKQRREEEQMATYNRNDLDGWEFKIMRSALGRFSSQRAVEKVCREEAPAGWELVEKFDECRLRFKRRVERRANDHLATVDPYRTSVGFQGGTTASIVLGLILVAAGLLAFFWLRSGGGLPDLGSAGTPWLLLASLGLVAALALIFLKRRR